MLERIGGFLIGCLSVLTLVLVGVVMFIPDAGRYLKFKNM
jgi:hypothetical protein